MSGGESIDRDRDSQPVIDSIIGEIHDVVDPSTRIQVAIGLKRMLPEIILDAQEEIAESDPYIIDQINKIKWEALRSR